MMGTYSFIGVSFYLTSEVSACVAHARRLIQFFGGDAEAEVNLQSLLASKTAIGGHQQGFLSDEPIIMDKRHAILFYRYGDTILLVGIYSLNLPAASSQLVPKEAKRWKAWFTDGPGVVPYSCLFAHLLEHQTSEPTTLNTEVVEIALSDNSTAKLRIIDDDFLLTAKKDSNSFHEWAFNSGHLFHLIVHVGKSKQYHEQLEKMFELDFQLQKANATFSAKDLNEVKHKCLNLETAIENILRAWKEANLNELEGSSLGRKLKSRNDLWKRRAQEILDEITDNVRMRDKNMKVENGIKATSIDVAIVIPLQEEFDVLHEIIKNDCKPEKHADTSAYDYVFSWPKSIGYRCVATFVGDMGETQASLRTQQIQTKWNPKTVVVLGIAAGISNDVKVGDVVVGTIINSYLQNAKAVPKGATSYSFEFSGEVYRSSSDLVNESRHLPYAHQKIFQKWCGSAQQRLYGDLSEGQIRNLTTNGLVREAPIVQTGHIASGPVVAAAKAFIAKVKEKDRKYLALEMESGGVLAAVYQVGDPSRSLVVRGISDFGDSRKDELDAVGGGGLRKYAMQNAIHFLWALMECGALPKAESVNP